MFIYNRALSLQRVALLVILLSSFDCVDVLPIILGGRVGSKCQFVFMGTISAYSSHLLNELVGLRGLENPTKSC